MPMNLDAWELSSERARSGLLSGKLCASSFPTLAPEGAHALPVNLPSDTTSISIVLLPLLLKTILPLTEVTETNTVQVDGTVFIYSISDWISDILLLRAS